MCLLSPGIVLHFTRDIFRQYLPGHPFVWYVLSIYLIQSRLINKYVFAGHQASVNNCEIKINEQIVQNETGFFLLYTECYCERTLGCSGGDFKSQTGLITRRALLETPQTFRAYLYSATTSTGATRGFLTNHRQIR